MSKSGIDQQILDALCRLREGIKADFHVELIGMLKDLAQARREAVGGMDDDAYVCALADVTEALGELRRKGVEDRIEAAMQPQEEKS